MCLGCCIFLTWIAIVVGSPPFIDSDPSVFEHGEDGYPCIRVPSMIRTPTSLLAFAGTRCTAGDGCFPSATTINNNNVKTHMDLVMKRSTDGGHTWSSMEVLYSATCDDRDHGTPVFDEVRGRIVMVTRGAGTLTWTFYSDDDGKTWSKPVQIPLGPHNTSRPSPGTGLQLRQSNPIAPGRLVFVAQLGSGKSADKGNIVYWSDDGGESWSWSKDSIVPDGQEAQIVELANGTLLMNARVGLEKGHEYYRLFATSEDGGASWSDHTQRRYDLAAASCMGSFISLTHAEHTGTNNIERKKQLKKELIFYSHAASFTDRSNGTVWISDDNGVSFKHFFQVSPKDHSTPFAYNCMSSTNDKGAIALLYETGAHGCEGPSCRIAFTQFSVSG